MKIEGVKVREVGMRMIPYCICTVGLKFPHMFASAYASALSYGQSEGEKGHCRCWQDRSRKSMDGMEQVR